MERLTKKKIVEVLNDLCGKRFTRNELKIHLTLKFLSRVEIEESTEYDDDEYEDHNLLLSIQDGDKYYEGDIYYLKTRNPEKIYVTEVYWDFEP